MVFGQIPVPSSPQGTATVPLVPGRGEAPSTHLKFALSVLMLLNIMPLILKGQIILSVTFRLHPFSFEFHLVFLILFIITIPTLIMAVKHTKLQTK